MSNIVPTPVQKLAFKTASQNFCTVFGGGIRAGKSVWLILNILTYAFTYDNSRWAFVRSTHLNLTKNFARSFSNVMAMGFHKYVRTWTKDSVILTNGSEILFMAESFDSDKEHTRFLGLEVNGFGLDELNELQESTFNKCIERAGSWNNSKGCPPKILGTCNPNNGYVKRIFYNNFIADTMPENFAFVPANIFNNPHIDKLYLESLKLLPPVQYRRFVLGDWEINDEVENAFATQFRPEIHVSKHCQLIDNKQLYISIDFNLVPFCAIVAHIWRDGKGDHLHIIDAIEIKKGSIISMCEELRTKYYYHLPNCIITGDAMGNRGELSQRDNASLYEQIKRELRLTDSQLKVPANPTHENSRADVNYILFHHPDVQISETNCARLIYDLQNVEVDAEGKIKKANRKVVAQRADNIDCFVGETLIITSEGNKRIDSIKLGDKVKTQNGFNHVVDLWDSVADVYRYTFSDGTTVECTPDHKFYSEGNGFIAISSVFEENKTVWKQKYYTAVEHLGSTANKNITTQAEKTKSSIRGRYIDKCTLMLSAKYPRGMMFTTKTMTHSITRLKILNLLNGPSICESMGESVSKQTPNLRKRFKVGAYRVQRLGTPQRLALNGTKKMRTKTILVKRNTGVKRATIARKFLLKKLRSLDFVVTTAKVHTDEATTPTTLSQSAKYAQKNLPPSNINRADSVVQCASPHQILKVVKSEYLGQRKVYDITVEREHEFYANGILVHNCFRYLINTHLKKWILSHQARVKPLPIGMERPKSPIVLTGTNGYIYQ